jgi:hypothetical protein
MNSALKKTAASFLIIVLAVLLLVGCLGEELELTKKVIGNFSISETKSESGNTVISLSGFSFHSALGVSRINTEIQGDTLIIRIYVDIKNRDGNFSLIKEIPSNIKKVMLFDDIIWSRDTPSAIL